MNGTANYKTNWRPKSDANFYQNITTLMLGSSSRAICNKRLVFSRTTGAPSGQKSKAHFQKRVKREIVHIENCKESDHRLPVAQQIIKQSADQKTRFFFYQNITTFMLGSQSCTNDKSKL